MKLELQELRRRGAKSCGRQYGERTCARCQRPLGKFWNSGSVCRGCSHRICSRCRVSVGAADWQCTVCHAYRCSKKSPHWLSVWEDLQLSGVTPCRTTFHQVSLFGCLVNTLFSYHQSFVVLFLVITGSPFIQSESLRTFEHRTLSDLMLYIQEPKSGNCNWWRPKH